MYYFIETVYVTTYVIRTFFEVSVMLLCNPVACSLAIYPLIGIGGH